MDNCNRKKPLKFHIFRGKSPEQFGPSTPTVSLCSPFVCFLTDAVWDDLQQVLCEQQVSESQEAVQLWGKLLQTILWHIQTHQSAEVPQLLQTHDKYHLVWATTTTITFTEGVHSDLRDSCDRAALKNLYIKLDLLVVTRTAGYGPATAPSGWGEHRGCRAEEGTKKREGEEGEHRAVWLMLEV